MVLTELRPAAPMADICPIRARLARIHEGVEFPALSKQIIDMFSSLDDDAHSLQRLTNVVLREYSLTLSVVRTANSVHYRRGARPIQGVTHAMLLLGARTVRQLASSLLLFENYSRKSPQLKELMLMSLLTANHARATALHLQLPEPEEAHLGGMFHNLGEVLIAAHFPEDHGLIRTLMQEQGKSESTATEMVLGFAYADLGAELSRQWGLPDSVVQGIRAHTIAATSPAAAIAAFSHDLTQALYRTGATSSQIAVAVEHVIVQHGSRLKLSREDVTGIVAETLEETRELLQCSSDAGDRLRFKQLVTAARSGLGAKVATPEPENDVEDTVVRELTLRARLRAELEEHVDPAAGTSIGAVLLQALEAIMRGGPYDRVLACFLTTDRQQLVARTGLGDGVDALIERFQFPVSVRGGPVVALTQQRQATYLPADRSLNHAELRWAQQLNVAQFGVFPLVVRGKVVGCLYCDRLGDAASPDRATIRFTALIAELVVDAIGRRRNG
ncbi:HDOD domain-containing protein [Gemmatimonas sp.]|uniref:HDOD domain-containing protein n=1 Tax=Gemmatimonas sp. TaxID=1962908 RepID=UPI0025BBBAF1|nr:HDOD domain-containing protein [Gemmatimonas sp.]MCA2990131.1 HDOD domain-containing protein [Gemmatimonas sp.]